MVQFLVENPLFDILICLGFGYLFGKINLGKFPNNATLGTLYGAIILNIIITGLGGKFDGNSVDTLKTLFFALFAFVIGYEAGPVFKNSIKNSGISTSIKLIGLSLFYCICVLGCAFALCKIFGFPPDKASGFLAGSQTQSTILNDESNVVAYAVTYILATVGFIIFVQNVAPSLTKTSLTQSVIDKVGEVKKGSNSKSKDSLKINVQIRAYRIEEASDFVGKTISELTFIFNDKLLVEAVYRNDEMLKVTPNLKVLASDIIVVAGRVKDIDTFNKNNLTEMTDEKYLSLEITKVDVVIGVKKTEGLLSKFENHGIIVNSVKRNGRTIKIPEEFIEEDVVTITGKTKSIEKCIENVGFIRDDGDKSDIPILMLAIALAAVLGVAQVPGLGFSIGVSCCSLIIGLILGITYERFPIIGQMSSGARWILKSLGLNLFIAATALEHPLSIKAIFTVDNIFIVIAGLISIFLPAVVAVIFGRYVLKLPAADLYGGMCGSATSTPALNSISEKAGSTIFTVGYAPAFVTSNICLTLTGTILLALL